MQQVTDTILMIRPVCFRMNKQTAIDNFFQKGIKDVLPVSLNQKAQSEFDNFVSTLEKSGVNVIVVPDTENPETPDSIFPNNWISFHQNADIAIYPMFAENRRLERREDVLEIIEQKGFIINNIVDYTEAETQNYFLEGTGSVVLDRINRKAYCALSNRSDEELFIEFCEDFEFFPVIFRANQTVDGVRKPIYHTNVMMSISETFAIICLDTIDDKKERKELVKHLKLDKKEIIEITEEQMHQFAGNTLQVKSKSGNLLQVMSSSAFKSLTNNQISRIEKHCEIIHSSLNTIEICGGGSARCMMAEVFLPKK